MTVAVTNDLKSLGRGTGAHRLYTYICSLAQLQGKPDAVVELICEDYQEWVIPWRANGKPYVTKTVKRCLQELIDLGLVKIVRKLGSEAWWVVAADPEAEYIAPTRKGSEVR